MMNKFHIRLTLKSNPIRIYRLFGHGWFVILNEVKNPVLFF